MRKDVVEKPVGGIAPFGYRWSEGELVIDSAEEPIRRLIYELFLKHRRKKTVANLLTDLGHRTRSGALFSDTTIGRLLRDTTAIGVREVNGIKTKVPSIVTRETWDRANVILGDPKPKRSINLFSGLIYCGCRGLMVVPSNSQKYVCTKCRRKIPIDDIEAVFHSQLDNGDLAENNDLFLFWDALTQKDKRVIIEQICRRIVVDGGEIQIDFEYSPEIDRVPLGDPLVDTSEQSPADGPVESTAKIEEPLLSEALAAKFLGISKMTLLRKRNSGEISFFRVGFRVLYSKEKHLIPFLATCEKGKYG